jgi:uncharacterized protein YbaP (TraB family)
MRIAALASILTLAIAGPASAAPAAADHHSLWSVQGRNNTVYLLGSVHFLSESEQLPAVMDEAYRNAKALVMEIDLDDLDPVEMQQATLELGVLPPDSSLEQQLGPQTYAKVAAKAREVGVDPALLARFRPWLAAITLVQLHMTRMGLDPDSGVERRFAAQAVRDGKPIRGLETLREQLGMLAALSDEQQREFLLYSVEDTERMAQEIDQLLRAWRSGDTQSLAKLLAEGFDQYPDLYRPLTVDRNRKWMTTLEQLLHERQDYLVIVGTLHLVGKDSVIDLLERAGYRVVQR